MPDWYPQIDLARCISCRQCIMACPTHALGEVAGKAALVAPDLCTYCADCESLCPSQAIALPYLVCFSPNSNTGATLT